MQCVITNLGLVPPQNSAKKDMLQDHGGIELDILNMCSIEGE